MAARRCGPRTCLRCVFIGGEGRGVVFRVGRKRIREGLGSDDRIAGTFPEQGNATRRVAEQHHAPGSPLRHIHAGDGVEISLPWRTPCLERAGGVPTTAGVGGLDQTHAQFRIAAVDSVPPAEDEGVPRHPGRRMKRQGGSRLVVHQHGGRICDQHRGGHGAHEHAQGAGKALCGAEGQGTDSGMDSDGADHQVKAARRRPVNLDNDPSRILLQGRHWVVGNDATVLPGPGQQQVEKFMAGNLDLPSSAAALARGDRGLCPAAGVDEHEAFNTGGRFLQARPDAHSP